MQCLEVIGAVRLIYRSLCVKGLIVQQTVVLICFAAEALLVPVCMSARHHIPDILNRHKCII